MPRPRFENLDPEKRERILSAAAQAFAENGFDGASLNQILDAAGISKGAAYYYFDDKADLFATVVDHYFVDYMKLTREMTDELTADNFWVKVPAYYRRFMEHFVQMPWSMGLMRAIVQLSEEARSGPLNRCFAQAQNWVGALIHKGRALGLVRRDLPEGLLTLWMTSLDFASDRWMAENDLPFDEGAIDGLLRLLTDTMHRLLDPPADPDWLQDLGWGGEQKEEPCDD